MAHTIFVAAATGTIGKAVALELRRIDWAVHTTVRNVDSRAAQELASAGVKLFPGDWDNEEALRAAMAGCTGLFLNLALDFTDISAEERWANRLLKVAKEAGATHVVYSGGGLKLLENFNDATGFIAAVTQSKKRVAEAVETAGFATWTSLLPAGFMANWVEPKMGTNSPGLVDGTWDTALKPETVMMSVDERDVAAFVVAAFKDPEGRFHNREVAIASDARSTADLFTTLSRVIGRELGVNYLSEEEVAARAPTDPALEIQRLTRDMAKHFDMDEIRGWGIPLHTFEEWLEREKESVEQTYNLSK